jgi:crossover junction endodeoxyribonuclease RusA
LQTNCWHAKIPVHLETEFLFKRPKSHLRTNGKLKPSAPIHCTSRVGDIEKLIRAVADALTGVAYEDDSQIVSLTSLRRYATTCEREGVYIRLTVLRAD